ncbi:hypothetical protein K438DRAFT_1753384 [Mycena galopus ATCC 62051]|nr:hypothetical protein K438DRAFT_1753384 [Mycena galopus ATCC 62051]
MAILSKVLLALIAASVVVGQSLPWWQCGGQVDEFGMKTRMDRIHYVHSWMDLRSYKYLLFSMLASHRDHHIDPHDSVGHDEYDCGRNFVTSFFPNLEITTSAWIINVS